MLKKALHWYRASGYINFYCSSPINRCQKESLTQKSGKNYLDNHSNFDKVNSDDMISSRAIANQCNDLNQLYQAIAKYKGCSLYKTANKTVIFDGNPQAKIMLIGEAPGANEDEKGIPFCGQSGKLLDNIIASIGLDRTNVYITNTVFWRPPGNRRPSEEELEICRPFVERHIALIKPSLILMVGGTAVESLLKIKSAITRIKGEYFDYTNQYLTTSIKSTAIFHPSYLLRQQSQKKIMWFDMIKIADFIAQNQIII